jgi:hypothetical protein
VTQNAWVEAGMLRAGDQLRGLGGGGAIVVGAAIVAGAADMWDLTVAQDHDFLIDTVVTLVVLVHNCPTFEGTNTSDWESDAYHFERHGNGATEEQYFSDAKAFAKNPRGTSVKEVTLKNGKLGTRCTTPGEPGGIISNATGRPVSFWYRSAM